MTVLRLTLFISLCFVCTCFPVSSCDASSLTDSHRGESAFLMKYQPPSLFRAITFLNHTVPDFTDNGASNFIKYGNDYYATSETNYIRKIDPVTLETQDKVLPSAAINTRPCETLV